LSGSDPLGESRHELALELSAAHREVRVARSLVARFARMEGMLDHDVEPLLFVVSELLANAIDHGGGGQALSEVDLKRDVRMKLFLEVRPASWTAVVTDQGGGDAESVRQRLEAGRRADADDERGRGLALIAQMVDRFEVERSPDGRGLMFIASKQHGRG
jgi:anti-sigma regulatory factor (Ser/Thr protein kinase)